MGSKLARRNKALKKQVKSAVEASQPKKDLAQSELDAIARKTELDETGEGLSQGRYRLTATSGHYVVLFARSLDEARKRWNEFYPKAKCDTCNRMNG